MFHLFWTIGSFSDNRVAIGAVAVVLLTFVVTVDLIFMRNLDITQLTPGQHGKKLAAYERSPGNATSSNFTSRGRRSGDLLKVNRHNVKVDKLQQTKGGAYSEMRENSSGHDLHVNRRIDSMEKTVLHVSKLHDEWPPSVKYSVTHSGILEFCPFCLLVSGPVKY